MYSIPNTVEEISLCSLNLKFNYHYSNSSLVSLTKRAPIYKDLNIRNRQISA